MAVCLGHRVPSSFRMPLLSFPAFTDPLLERIPIRLGNLLKWAKGSGEMRERWDQKGRRIKEKQGDRNTSHTSPRGDLLPDISLQVALANVGPFHMVPQEISCVTLKYFASAEFHSFATNNNLILMMTTFTEAPGHRLSVITNREKESLNCRVRVLP